MLYNFKSKFNVHEIQKLLREDLNGLFVDIKRCPWDKAKKSKVYMFEGKYIKTGEVRRLRVRYVSTENWGRRFHVHSLECQSHHGHGYFAL